MTYITYMTDSTYMTYITYMTDSTYSTYITDTFAFPEVSIHDTTRHGMTLLHTLTYGSCAHGKGKGTEEKKKVELCTFMLPEVTNTYSSPCSPICMQRAGKSCLSLACSVASLSHPSVATCQTIMTYSMIALQTAS